MSISILCITGEIQALITVLYKLSILCVSVFKLLSWLAVTVITIVIFKVIKACCIALELLLTT